ncbi:hypothetical protein [Nocardia sp. NPDC049526]|uniref:hypothetical protein n=1 Tax=Nocardia sp. NPDC049526 TaxID=3364316 RepID=UPI00379EB3D5
MAEVGAALSHDRAALIRELYHRLSSEIAELRGEESLQASLVASIEGNVETSLPFLQYGVDIGQAEAPPAAIEYARRLANTAFRFELSSAPIGSARTRPRSEPWPSSTPRSATRTC